MIFPSEKLKTGAGGIRTPGREEVPRHQFYRGEKTK
jgi:hypothetical protein